MVPASLYQSVYLLIVTLMTLYAMSLYNKWGKQFNTRNSSHIVAFLLLFVIWFIGTRPLNGKYFIDMANYYQSYNIILGERFFFDRKAENLLFDNWFTWMASHYVSFSFVMQIFSAVYFGLMFVGCRKLFPKDTLLAFIVYLAAFSTFSYGTNGMKAGMATSLFLVAIAYREKLWISIPVALLTYGFHHSMTLVIGSYFVALFIKNPKYYFLGWLFCLLMAAFHVTFFQTLFAGFTDEHGAGYLLVDEETTEVRIGFRPDFILYSAIPIFLGYLAIYRYKFQSDMYSFLLRLYIMANAMWLLCMYAEFNNRIAYLSWFMYPFVLLYPFVGRERNLLQGKYFRWVVYGHLGFTLFMTFIYY